MLKNKKKSDPSCYITYEKYQRGVSSMFSASEHKREYSMHVAWKPSLLGKMYENEQEATAFKPTWLIDTSDMSVVSGAGVHGPYYTLSYSWNQSGDYFKNEFDDGYTRIDRGRHKIVLDPIYYDYERNGTLPVRVRYVKFEELVQEICQDLGARYVWWDQMCIDQSNKEEKRREIKQMHRIYENASRTIVLVPEFACEIQYDGETIYGNPKINFLKLIDSQWFKRVWTLVEGFKSRKLLFVGRNVYMYSEKVPKKFDVTCVSHLLSTICTTGQKWSACLALSHSLKRATTKKHDYYFAFANMFPEKLGSLKFSYDQDIQKVALAFYRRLAQNDPTILFFSAPDNGEEKLEKTMLGLGQENNYFPSWTGIHGVHPERLFKAGEFNQSSFRLSDGDYIVSGSAIKVTCTFITVSIITELEYSDWRAGNRPPIYFLDFPYKERVPEYGHSVGRHIHYSCVPKNLPSYSNSDLTFFVGAIEKEEADNGVDLSIGMTTTTHYLSSKVDSPYQYGSVTKKYKKGELYGRLSLTEHCDHCIILYGMRYIWKDRTFCYTVAPVVTKNGSHYKSIGLCVFEKHFSFPNIQKETKHTFVIR